MSKAAQRNGAAAPKRTAGSDDGDICPVCKSARYLNPQMKFLVNPECYHKMCESCVDRIFSSGPAPCPIAGCRRTLRKARFRNQTFEDVQIEREVDIRRKVAKVFNRCEEDFETLKDYNNYLNDVEDITYNLISGIDVEASEKKLERYAEANRQLIAENETRASKQATTTAAQQEAVREKARLRREADLREEEQERQELREGRLNIINKLASGEDANQVAKEGQVNLKRRSGKLAIPDRRKQPTAASDGDSMYKGLKKRAENEPEQPFSPFGGLRIENSYSVVQDQYDAPWLSYAWTEDRYLAGGYKISDYYNRAFTEAFSGLSVFVDEETAGRNITGAAEATISATVAAVSKEVDMDDVF